MSSRTKGSTNKHDELHDLLSKLENLLLASSSGCDKRKVGASKILKEACSYIKSLQLEVDHLSETLSQLLDSKEKNDTEKSFSIC